MDIPANLLQEVKRGNAVLFLGAGASMEAKNNDGIKMYGVSDLINKISKRFLGGEATNYPLVSVAELAISEADLLSVQKFISELFIDFQPADFHFKIPMFKWKSIFSTNYDLIIEKVYEKSDQNSQNLVPIYSSSDNIDSLIKCDNDLPYTKLHGCITKIDEDSPPLILTTDQYVTHRNKRDKLFDRLKIIGSTSTIVFVGHSLQDPDIRLIFHEIASMTSSRPRFYAVLPEFSEMEQRLWENKRITLIKNTFDGFLSLLETSISSFEREFKFKKHDHDIERKFISNDFELTTDTLAVLDSQLTYVHAGIPTAECRPKMFYHGYSKDWGAIQNNLDILRTLIDEFISEVMLTDEHEKNAKSELYLISGSAGSGKSIILKRIAWDSATEYEKICLYWSSDNRINYNAIIEIAEKVGERIYLFIDRPATHVSDLMLLLKKIRDNDLKVTCIVAERTNEWNTECKALHKFLTEKFSIRYLSYKEIEALIAKLDKYNCLGVLKGKPIKDQISAFHEKAGRQLLVALHEATMAKSFQDIIFDEYRNIVPEKAKLIYRTICVMNRIDVPVRAGIIKRIHGVNFEEFQEHFFAPLENVVKSINYTAAFDQAYQARHPWIAEMVFTHSLKKEDDRLDVYLNLIDALDIGYSPDRTAFRELIKYRSLAELYNDPSNIEKIYDSAYLTCGDDDYYYQQRAIFNMRRKNPNFIQAEELLYLAEKYGQYNKTIAHTKAELELARANKSKGIEKEKFYNKAIEFASTMTGRNSDSSHGYDTLCKIELLRLEVAINSDDDELIAQSTNKCESLIRESLQLYPDDERLLAEEAKLAKLLMDSSRAKKALLKAFNINTKNTFLGSSLAKVYLSLGQTTDAIDILKQLLDAKPADKIAHGKMAKILVDHFPNDSVTAEYHWQRSFTDGDTNFLNQLWYARQLYINEKYNEYLNLINKLKKLRLPPKTRHNVRGILINENKQPLDIIGKCIRKEATYALFESPKYKGTHFLHKGNCDELKWDNLKVGSVNKYILGFTFSGVAAIL